MTEQWTLFWRQACLVLLGATVGFVPAYLNTRTEAQIQDERDARQRKITALAEFSKAAMLPVPQLISRCDAIDRYLRYWKDASNPRGFIREARKQIDELVAAENQWIAELNTHGPTLSSLFGMKIGRDNFIVPDKDASDSEELKKTSIKQDYEELIAQIRSMRSHISETSLLEDSIARSLMDQVR